MSGHTPADTASVSAHRCGVTSVGELRPCHGAIMADPAFIEILLASAAGGLFSLDEEFKRVPSLKAFSDVTAYLTSGMCQPLIDVWQDSRLGRAVVLRLLCSYKRCIALLLRRLRDQPVEDDLLWLVTELRLLRLDGELDLDHEALTELQRCERRMNPQPMQRQIGPTKHSVKSESNPERGNRTRS